MNWLSILPLLPEYDFVTDDHITHQFWIVDNDSDINIITEEFAKLKTPTLLMDIIAQQQLLWLAKKDEKILHTQKKNTTFFWLYISPTIS